MTGFFNESPSVDAIALFRLRRSNLKESLGPLIDKITAARNPTLALWLLPQPLFGQDCIPALRID